MGFKIQKLKIPGLMLITSELRTDERGFFVEVYKYREFVDYGIKENFLQVNHSRSRKGVIRGLHYQLQPAAQAKLVRAIVGEIFDVAVDIRRGSPSYGKWVGVLLKGGDGQMFYMPEGFAHGFCALSESAELEYFSTKEYSPDLDRGIVWNDPELNIQWPVTEPVLSKKDSQHPALAAAEINFQYAAH